MGFVNFPYRDGNFPVFFFLFLALCLFLEIIVELEVAKILERTHPQLVIMVEKFVALTHL